MIAESSCDAAEPLGPFQDFRMTRPSPGPSWPVTTTHALPFRPTFIHLSSNFYSTYWLNLSAFQPSCHLLLIVAFYGILCCSRICLFFSPQSSLVSIIKLAYICFVCSLFLTYPAPKTLNLHFTFVCMF